MGCQMIVITWTVSAALSAGASSESPDITPRKYFQQMAPFIQAPGIISFVITITKISYNIVISNLLTNEASKISERYVKYLQLKSLQPKPVV